MKLSSITSNFVYTTEVILNQYVLSYGPQPSAGVFSFCFGIKIGEKT